MNAAYCAHCGYAQPIPLLGVQGVDSIGRHQQWILQACDGLQPQAAPAALRRLKNLRLHRLFLSRRQLSLACSSLPTAMFDSPYLDDNQWMCNAEEVRSRYCYIDCCHVLLPWLFAGNASLAWLSVLSVTHLPASCLPSLPAAPVTVCVGTEWHRFPSSFFLPSPNHRLGFVDEGFTGLLPFPFDDSAGGTAAAPPHFNQLNRAAHGQFVSQWNFS